MRSKRFLSVTALTAVAVLLIGGIAVADDLDNQLDASLDADLETVNLAPGGATSTVTLKLHPNAGSAPDGDSGCNIDSGETLILAATSSNTGVATVSPTVTFTNCNERTITVTSVASGSTDITFTISSNNTGGGTYNLTGGNFKVVVSSPNTPPEVSVTGFSDGDSFEKGIDTLPTPGCDVTDAEDGNSNPAPTITPTLDAFGLGSVTVKCSYTDGGGLSDSDEKSYSIVDTTDPDNIAFTGGGISDGAEYYFGSVPAGPTGCTADDAGSGLASCEVTGGGSGVGSHSYTATATDNAGNDATATLSYTVLPWTLTGFYSPVDMNNVTNVAKGGSTVPLKFELFAASEITDTSAISGLKVQSINCSTLSNTADAIEQTSTGGTSLRYDSTAGQFIQNWKTPTGTGCYKVYVTTADGGVVGPAFFRTK